MEKPQAYLAHQLGFSETGRYMIDGIIKPYVRSVGIEVIDPFEVCGGMIKLDKLEKLERYDERLAFWKDFSLKVTPINNKLMQKSNLMLAILDGGHVIDDGVSSEIGYYAGTNQGKIIALRSDFRCGENIAVSINPQVLGYILMSGGALCDGKNAMDDWFTKIRDWYDEFKEK